MHYYLHVKPCKKIDFIKITSRFSISLRQVASYYIKLFSLYIDYKPNYILVQDDPGKWNEVTVLITQCRPNKISSIMLFVCICTKCFNLQWPLVIKWCTKCKIDNKNRNIFCWYLLFIIRGHIKKSHNQRTGHYKNCFLRWIKQDV